MTGAWVLAEIRAGTWWGREWVCLGWAHGMGQNWVEWDSILGSIMAYDEFFVKD